MRPHIILLLGLLACNKEPRQTSPAPAPVVEDDAGAVPASPAQPGLLTEAEFKAMHELKAEGDERLTGESITLSDGRTVYLSRPEDAVAGGPAVLVVHEWWGLNKHIKLWADRLAADGYTALAVDIYDGKVGTSADEAMTLMKAVDEEAAEAHLQAAHTYLREDPAIQASRVGSIGWCFGGSWSLRAGLILPLEATVIYYGRLQTVPAQLASLNHPVLGIFGKQDAGIPLDSIRAFEEARPATTPLTIHIFDAAHAFANPSSQRYNQAAAEEAWSKTQAFLRDHLKAR
ncbi:MAG: dienelactone hydrolase family protein [Myxococcota bacterium]